MAVMSSVGAVSRGFLFGLNRVEVTGLDNLLGVLDRRKAPGGRERGLLTVCNHVAVYVNVNVNAPWFAFQEAHYILRSYDTFFLLKFVF